MCGIAGWYAWGKDRPSPSTITGLLLANMERGTSATGMAWLENGEIIVRKGKGPASDFIANTDEATFKAAAASPRGLLHARATTKGSENENVNNHPVFGLGWLAVHNGTINNDDDLWGFYAEKEGVKRFAEVDTSAIPLMLSRGKTTEESIPKLTVLSGSATIAAWSEERKDDMLLARFGHNDLHMFFDAARNILYWSSAASAGYVMRGILMGRHKFLTMSRLADQHVLLLSPEGMEATRVFKLTQRPFRAARKVVVRDTGNDGTQHKDAGNRGGQRTYEESLPVRSSSASPITSTPPVGLKDLLARTRQRELIAGKDYVKVMFQVPNDAKMLAAVWRPMEIDHGKPLPMSDVFNKVWWNLSGLYHALDKDKLILEVTRDSAYGRWTFGREKGTGEHYLSFKGHKRTKAWWDRIYRMHFKFPLELFKDGQTELDDHLAWEHYDIQLQKLDGSTTSFLGFMCPWCGVWLSSTRVQEMRHRCEFCCIHSRMEESHG